uniref:Transmembrane protein 182 n=1 Tax=Seriola dumerili TaxID=41447 RepID=A0A3B4UAE6_SERDU
MSPAERMKLLLFLALFFGAVGFLFMLLSCGTEYWLLAAESCSRPEDRGGVSGLREGKNDAVNNVRIFHEGLFWRCSFMVTSHDFSTWDLWIQPYEHHSAIGWYYLFMFYMTVQYEVSFSSSSVFRTFWSIFLVAGVAAVVVGGFFAICAGPLTNHRLYKVGGVLQLCGGLCLLAVVLMYLMWVQVLDTLEQFALHQSLSSCPSFHLSIQHGPSFLLAPVAVFFCLLAGLLFILVGRTDVVPL